MWCGTDEQFSPAAMREAADRIGAGDQSGTIAATHMEDRNEWSGEARRVLDMNPAPWSLELLPARDGVRGATPSAVLRDANTKAIDPLALVPLGTWLPPHNQGSATLINTSGDADVLRFIVEAVNDYAGKPDGHLDAEVEELPPSPSMPDWGSEESLKRLVSDWTRYAKEPVGVEYSGHAYIGYGTELACMRLFAIYRNPSKTRVAYSTNLKTWFFTLELS